MLALLYIRQSTYRFLSVAQTVPRFARQTRFVIKNLSGRLAWLIVLVSTRPHGETFTRSDIGNGEALSGARVNCLQYGRIRIHNILE